MKAEYQGSDCLGLDTHTLKCSICGEETRSKILIEDLGISIGMGGDSYTFCMKCWLAKDLGLKLLDMLGITELKYKDECIKYIK